MKLKDLLKGREKLKEYDELKEWKDYFEKNIIVKKGDGNPFAYVAENLPTHIKDIIVKAIEAEIAKLEEK